jgi:hypothetical protein
MATGGTGEFPHLSAEERVQATKAIVAGAAGRVPVFANVSSCATDEAVSLALTAAEVGADAIISVPPYYFPLSEAALFTFFTTLADRSPLPLFVYNNPGYTGNPFIVGVAVREPSLKSERQPQTSIDLFHLQAVQVAQTLAQIALVQGHYLTYVDYRVAVQARGANCHSDVPWCCRQPQIRGDRDYGHSLYPRPVEGVC